jgi:hypothetical protein
MKVVVAFVALGVTLAGCATGYQSSGLTGGYTDLQLSADTYRVTVQGNGYTSTARAENIGLLRAAELTIQNGYERFVMLSGGVAQENAGTTDVTVNRIGNTLVASGGDTIRKPSGSIVFRMLKRGDPAYASALDAKLIQAQLRAQLGVTS